MDLHRPSALALACLAMAGVDQQAVQPGVEPVRVTKSPDVPPGGDERLLCGILGGGVVAQDQPGHDEEPAGRDARQLCERVVIARHRPLHEIPSHRASGCAWPGWPRYGL